MAIAEFQTIPDEPETISEENEILLKAENYIIEHGWCKGYFEDKSGSVCIVGALHAAATGKPNGPFSNEEVTKVLLIIKRLPLDIVRWNDAPNTTKEDVIRVLRKARS